MRRWGSMKKNVIGILMCIAAMLILASPMATLCRAAETGKTARTHVQSLAGRWVRPDGGYVLELGEMGKDGSLKAAYFNPRPINVHRARYELKDGNTEVFVELRDVNYPGSRYHLRYDPGSDQLLGTYYQAVEKQTFQVRFVRGK